MYCRMFNIIIAHIATLGQVKLFFSFLSRYMYMYMYMYVLVAHIHKQIISDKMCFERRELWKNSQMSDTIGLLYIDVQVYFVFKNVQ